MAKVPTSKKEYRLLDGSQKTLLERVGDGSIITRFEKTPLPQAPTDVVCPHFLELKWATGCPFSCAWCYLQGTLRLIPTRTKPYFKGFERIERHVRIFLEQADGYPELLNTGELSDSLMWERNGSPFSKFIISLFSSQKIHRVLFVTKSTDIGNLLLTDHQNLAIISFSLNAPVVAKRYEMAPSVAARIQAAKNLTEVGYKVRVRIDPLVPVPNWEAHYKELIDSIFTHLIPERITLGSLRGLRSTINQARDKSWVEFLEEKTNWGMKIPFDIRVQMYSLLIEHLKQRYSYTEVGLCKETLMVWKAVDMDYKRIKCNCIL